MIHISSCVSVYFCFCEVQLSCTNGLYLMQLDFKLKMKEMTKKRTSYALFAFSCSPVTLTNIYPVNCLSSSHNDLVLQLFFPALSFCSFHETGKLYSWQHSKLSISNQLNPIFFPYALSFVFFWLTFYFCLLLFFCTCSNNNSNNVNLPVWSGRIFFFPFYIKYLSCLSMWID